MCVYQGSGFRVSEMKRGEGEKRFHVHIVTLSFSLFIPSLRIYSNFLGDFDVCVCMSFFVFSYSKILIPLC